MLGREARSRNEHPTINVSPAQATGHVPISITVGAYGCIVLYGERGGECIFYLKAQGFASGGAVN